MKTLGAIAAVLNLASFFTILFASRRIGQRIYDAGHKDGRKAADAWWIRADHQIEMERENIRSRRQP